MLDDVIEHTSAWSSHVSRLRTFLERVRVANLAIKPSKCFVGFQDVFTDLPKVTGLGEHSIQLTSTEPIRSKAYHLR